MGVAATAMPRFFATSAPAACCAAVAAASVCERIQRMRATSPRAICASCRTCDALSLACCDSSYAAFANFRAAVAGVIAPLAYVCGRLRNSVSTRSACACPCAAMLYEVPLILLSI